MPRRRRADREDAGSQRDDGEREGRGDGHDRVARLDAVEEGFELDRGPATERVTAYSRAIHPGGRPIAGDERFSENDAAGAKARPVNLR